MKKKKLKSARYNEWNIKPPLVEETPFYMITVSESCQNDS